MQRNCTQIKKWEIAEFIFIAIVGTLLHFVYDWSGQNPAVGIIASVSESTWEHLKLLFMPALLFTLIQEAVIGKDYPCLLTQKAKAVLASMAWIVVGFMTYHRRLGERCGMDRYSLVLHRSGIVYMAF